MKLFVTVIDFCLALVILCAFIPIFKALGADLELIQTLVEIIQRLLPW